MRRFLPVLLAFCWSSLLFSQTPADIAIPIQVSAGLNPPGVLLTWPNPTTSDIQLRRRSQGEPGDAWVLLLDESATFRNGYFDTTGLSANATYEYALSRKTGPVQAYGYAYAAIAAPPVDARGKILVFVDSTSADILGADLVAYKNDLRGEGWEIIPFHTGPFTTVQSLKNQIINQYTADPTHIKAILLIGDVPVPYAGSTAWDNKSDHVGAWPCDAYYGDMNGVWSDQTVNLPNTARLANRNVPGDGKFDQNILPSAVEIPVGRLDFRHLSAATFGLPPVELLRRYFLKNHRWRTGQFEVPDRALVDDQLGWSGGEAFAADGYRNAYPLVDNQVVNGDFLSPANHRYLLAYGAGNAGTYNSAGGIGTAANFAADSVNMVVVNLFGDYFGDWDYENNPLLPALLASKGSVLACGWAGRPHWLLQGLAVGETMGFCLRETQNAQYNEAYGHSNGESATHVSLLGDPTLRLTIVKPATNLTAVSNCTKVNLHWMASPDPEVLGYLVYRAFSQDGPYTRLTPYAVTGTEWIDPNPVATTLYYSVRAMKWEVTPGGGNFYNTSTGILKSVVFQPGQAPTVIGLGGELNCTVESLTLGSNSQPSGATVQWFKPDGSLLNGFEATQGGVYTVVATAPNGCTAVAYASVTVDTFLPQPVLPAMVVLDCAHPTAQFTVPGEYPDVHYTWNGAPVAPDEIISIEFGGVFVVSSTSNGCSKSYTTTVAIDNVPPGADAISPNDLDCTHSFSQLTGISNAVDAQYAWSYNGGIIAQQNPVAIFPGTYCLTVTSSNGCTSVDCVEVLAIGEVVTTQILPSGGPCNQGGSTELGALALSGTPPFQYLWSNGSTGISNVLPVGFSGMVGLTITDAHGCVGNASYTVGAPLGFVVSKVNESGSGALDGSIELIVFGGILPYNFQWSNGSTNGTLTNLAGGLYTVTVTDAVGCSTVISISLSTVVAVESPALSQVRVSPNPATEVVGVYFPQSENAVLRLTDLSGRLVASQTGEAAHFFLPTDLLPGGLYVLTIEIPAGRKSFKLVVDH